MTTERDHGSDPPPTMLRCPITGSNLYPTLVAALRDMRHANGRLVERIVAEAHDQWDVTLLDTDVKL